MKIVRLMANMAVEMLANAPGRIKMFETAKERVDALKMGMLGKEIEQAYIEENGIEIIEIKLV